MHFGKTIFSFLMFPMIKQDAVLLFWQWQMDAPSFSLLLLFFLYRNKQFLIIRSQVQRGRLGNSFFLPWKGIFQHHEKANGLKDPMSVVVRWDTLIKEQCSHLVVA